MIKRKRTVLIVNVNLQLIIQQISQKKCLDFVKFDEPYETTLYNNIPVDIE